MRSLLGRKLSDSVSAAGSMILFLLFACCSLIMISAGAGTYARISHSFNETFDSSTAAKYITNKIRSGESSSVGNDGRTLTVTTGGKVCVITSEAEGITEVIRGADDSLDSGKKDVIFPAAEMLIEAVDDGLYRVVILSGGKDITVICRSKE